VFLDHIIGVHDAAIIDPNIRFGRGILGQQPFEITPIIAHIVEYIMITLSPAYASDSITYTFALELRDHLSDIIHIVVMCHNIYKEIYLGAVIELVYGSQHSAPIVFKV
jgi:hypothetical protein